MLARWRVVPKETPRVGRHCRRCGQRRWFRSSDAFRINAQQRRVDVWLIYKCVACESTWNCAIFDRVLPSELGDALYASLERNDRDTAWRLAFDLPRLSRFGVEIDADCAFEVERSAPAGAAVLELAYPLRVRLDKLLARELGVSRQALVRAARAGELTVDPGEVKALRRPVRDGQRSHFAAFEAERREPDCARRRRPRVR